MSENETLKLNHIEKWLRNCVKYHKLLVVQNEGSLNGRMHQERVFAYQNVLVELGLEKEKTALEYIEETNENKTNSLCEDPNTLSEKDLKAD